MKISSEIPVKYLRKLYYLNDFPFIINIYRDIPEYREFYIKACKENPYSFLDSGFFENWENGTNFDTSINALDEGVKIFNPGFVFSEEKFGDWEYTVNKSKEFKEHFKHTNTRIATCVHGQTLEDFWKCYDELLWGDFCDLIAFSHKFAFHESYVNEHPYLKCENKYLEYSLVRVDVIKRTLRRHVKQKPVHLLGCNNPIEIKLLSDEKYIISADTSSPVIIGANCKIYNPIGILPEGKMHQGKNYMNRKFKVFNGDDVNEHCAIAALEYNFDWLKNKLD
ncbi:hypothetical protein J6W34_00980 [bacterium]|nr:hypothetical protein [bacterium]